MAGQGSLQAGGCPIVQGFFDKRTSSVQYVVADPATRKCGIIDPVLDYEPYSGTIATRCADAILHFIERERLHPQWILDTHPHADHLSAAAHLKERLGVPVWTGDKVVDIQKLWKATYNFGDEFPVDGSPWDRLLSDEESFQLGHLAGRAILTPGHTLASIACLIGDAAFIHDTLFMPDVGTARADFPGGNARELWHSIARILALPPDTRLFTGHDYRPGGREPRYESTIAAQRAQNIHLLKAYNEDEFVALRTARDRTLPMPALILCALQVNLRAGRLPEPERNGKRYLKIPIGALPGAAWGD